MSTDFCRQDKGLKRSKMASTKWNWSCSSNYCRNSWRAPEILYRRLTKTPQTSKEVITQYLNVLGKTKGQVNWAKEVLFTAHWSKQPENFYINIDVPDVKFPARRAESDKNWHWNCSGVLCNNSWRTKDRNGANLKHYKLSEVTKGKGLKAAYDKIVKNKKVSILKQRILSCLCFCRALN